MPQQVWRKLLGEHFVVQHEFEDLPSREEVRELKSAKVALAHEVVDVFDAEDLSNSLDLKQRVEELIEHIRSWNSM